MTPEEIAKLSQDLARNRFLIRAQIQAAEQEKKRPSNESATYDRYDAETETHYVYPNQPVKNLLTNTGLLKGQPVEFDNGALDDTPRAKPKPKRRKKKPLPEPVWAFLIKRRAYVTTEPQYVPPKPDEYSDPTPATFYMIYYSSTFQGGAISSWNPGYDKRYCEGGSEQLCGKEYGNPLTNLDRDIYCRTLPVHWLAVPDANFQSLGLPGRRCHYAIAIELGGVRGLVGGIVIGCLAPASDGISEPPTDPPYGFPVVNYKVRNPLYPSGSYAPPGERYLACSVEQGDEVDMGWTQIEIIPFSEYVPPQLISPASPGGVYESDIFETQYWLVTNQGAVKVCAVDDVIYPEEFRAIGQDSSERISNVYLAVDEQGKIHVDLKILNPNFGEGAPFEVSLKHYQVIGLGVSEVTSSESWRQKFTNSLTDTPLPGTPLHPCADFYQASPLVNLALQDNKLIQSPLVYSLADFRDGKPLSLQVWQLPSGPVCSLEFEPDRRLDLPIVAFDDASIETAPSDAAPLSLVGVIAYV